MFNKNIFQKKKRNTSVRTENRTELFRKILSQELIDLEELENLCFEGIPEDNTIKATCWKILLGYLPLNTTEWKSHLQQQRNLYEFYINLLFQNPETYNNGQPYNNNNNNNKNNTQSQTPANDPLARPYSSRPASQSNFSDYVKHTTIIQPQNTATYFQDENSDKNNPKEDIKPIKKPSLFFEDSDDERIKPKPGLFDTDNETDDDTFDISINNNNNQKQIENINKDENINTIMSEDLDAETPVPNEIEKEVLNFDIDNGKKGIKQAQNEDITPSVSLKSNNSLQKDVLNDTLLKDLTMGNDEDDPLELLEKKNEKTPRIFSDEKTPKIFSDTSTETNTESSTPSKHSKKDSKILINGQDINVVNSKSRKKSDNIKPLDFQPTNAPDPLSKQPNNPWKTYFDDWEIWNRIKKDIHRTHQTYAFFRSNHMICEDSMSKKYRFPFDIESEPPPMTPSMSMPSNMNNNNFPLIKLDKQDAKHRKMDSAPILNVPTKNELNKHKHKGSASGSDTYDDSIIDASSDDTYDDNNNSDDNDNDNTKDEETDPKIENQDDELKNDDTETETKPVHKKRPSLLKIDADDEIISDIESIDDDNNAIPIPINQYSEDIKDNNNTPMKIDLPPPAPKNIQFSKTEGHNNVVSIHNKRISSDPNKKARIERYVCESKQHGIHAQVMIRILCVYARLNKGVEYVQGMNELLAPIYYIFNMDPSENNRYAEADSFFCFMNLMSYLADRFIAESDHSQLGIIAIVNEFDALLERVDFQLWNVLKKQDLDSKFYALRWLMLLMAMEFQLPEVLRLWDSFLSDHNRFEFVSYFAIAMLHKVRGELMSGNFASNLQLLQKYPSFDLYELLVPAMEFRNKYPLNRNNPKKKRKSRKNKHKNKLNVKNENKNRSKSKSKSRSPRAIFKNGQSSAKDLFGNILRPQSSRISNNRNTNTNRPNPAYNIFRSKSPNSQGKGVPTITRQNTFTFGSWKKKWGAK